jgi:type I restriction enzyme M protein
VDEKGRVISKDGVVTIPVGKVLCYITHKIRKNTPEENVRQRVARSLVQEYRYKKADIGIEFRLKTGSLTPRPRADILIFNEGTPHTQENIYIIAETKKPKTSPRDRKEGVEQLKGYISFCINAQFGLWTNGEEMLCFQKIQDKAGRWDFPEIIDIPPRGKTVEDFERPTFDRLRPAVDLRAVFKRCHNYIYGNQGLQKEPSFHELLKLIFCKIRDEKESGKEVRFYVTDSERRSTTGQLKVKQRMRQLFSEVKDQYPHIFTDRSEEINLNPDVLAYVLSQLQMYSFLDTDTDIKGEAYEEIVGGNLRGDRGEFFTPRNVCRLAIKILYSTYPVDEWKELKIIDPACGTGGFLVTALNVAKTHIFEEELAKWKDKGLAENRTEERIRSYCEKHLFGIDINPLLVRATQMNEVMHGNGSGNLISVNSLKSPAEWPEDLRGKVELGQFDIVLTNPPFGAKIPVDDPHILAQYDIAHLGTQNGKVTKSEELRKSVPPERLFVERCLAFAKPNGRVAIVLPDSILSNPGAEMLGIREWILRHARVIASIDLPTETFEPFVGTQTSLLCLQRKTDDDIRHEEETGVSPDYEAFMSVPTKVGHDRRGNPIYMRTPEGEIILVDVEEEITTISSGKKIRDKIRITKPVRQDDLGEVAERFKTWFEEKIT